MKELLKDKRVITLICAIVVALLTALGILSDDVKDAIHKATAPAVESPAVLAPAPSLAPEAK